MGAQVSQPDGATCAELQANVEHHAASAGQLLSSADVFLLLTGAGFSADSGLAVYADVAKVPAYQSRGLEYHDLCQPYWLKKVCALR